MTAKSALAGLPMGGGKAAIPTTHPDSPPAPAPALCPAPSGIALRAPRVRCLFGKLFGDRGYISQALAEQLFTTGIVLITKRRKNMRERVMAFTDKLLLRKRAIIESVNDQLKNIC